MAATFLLLHHFPPDRAGMRGEAGGATYRSAVLGGPLLSVSVRFAVACTVFFAAFFALPLWLLQSSTLGAVATGAVMAPMVIASALIMPLAIRTVARSGAAATSLVGNGCVWLSFRFPLSFGEVEELMLVRGVAVSEETIRRWCAKFGRATPTAVPAAPAPWRQVAPR